jgi:putative acetyltransferase
VSFRVRRLAREEMDAAALIFRTSFDERLPWLAGRHTPEEDRAYFRDRVFVECDLWGAQDESGLVGIIAFRASWIDQLYVLPRYQRSGVGGALLHIAKDANAALSLWTFQRNDGARRFYEANGFTAIRETSGRGNEEQEPDILYRWER